MTKSTIIGIVLIILSIVIFSVSIVLPQVITPFAPLFCGSGGQLTDVKNTIGDRTTLFCVDANGDKTDVTIAVSRVLGVIFGGLLVAGILVLTLGRSRARRSRWNNSAAPTRATQVFNAMGGTPASPNSSVDGLQRGVIRFGGKEISLDDLKSGAYQQQVTPSGQHTLADTLRQLEDAHKQGLIDDDEYSRLRQDTFNRLA